MLLSRTLRRSCTATALHHHHQQQQQLHRSRTLVTSAQKRALNQTQLEGTKESPPATAAVVTPPSSSSSSGAGGLGKLGLPLLLIGGGAAGGTVFMANQNNMSPYDYLMTTFTGSGGGGGGEHKKKERDAQLVSAVKEAMEEIKPTRKQESPPVGTPAVEDTVDKHQVVKKEEDEEEIVISLDHPENGNRVDIDKITTFYQTVNDGHAKQQQAQQQLFEMAQESATKATQYNESNETTTTNTIDPTVALTTASAAMSELQSNQSLQNSKTLAAAQAALRSDLDRQYFSDLDTLSPSELRTRVIQLATEMSDRTKWEAVRLKEFLAMKEKEVGDKYLDILQKQRLEFESLLAQKLREQEDVITRQANAALQAKEDSIANLLRATTEAREKETQDIVLNETRRITDELELEYTSKLQNELARMKQAYASDLEKHASVMELLQGKLELLSSRLEVSQNYESGSKRAHRVSAAALALASKLEVGEGAAVEIAALKGAAGGEGVIASAVGMIPPTAEKGVPTVAELQVAFDKSYTVGRQAAMVPEGRAGLGGQLMGMLFAKLSVPPSPDAVPTSEEEGNVTDGVLSLARKYVQVGDLEKAVEQLNKLKGQAAYVMKDWKSQAADRVATERALKVIKLECALLNKELV
ncbi:hypothetical protein ACHAXM_006452 [Skeletonema potamos]